MKVGARVRQLLFLLEHFVDCKASFGDQITLHTAADHSKVPQLSLPCANLFILCPIAWITPLYSVNSLQGQGRRTRMQLRASFLTW